MQQLMYRWLIFLGISHVLLGILFAVFANTSLFFPYLQYLFERFEATGTDSHANLLGTMVQLFGVTVASWGALFTIAVRQYWHTGDGLAKKGVCLAIIIWLVLDTAISLYWGIEAHAYLNIPVGLAMLLPMLFLQTKGAINYSVELPETYKLQNKKKLLITGGTGFIGKPLVQTLVDQGHDVIVLTRSIAASVSGIRGKVTFITSLDYLSSDEQIDIIINLAGESLAGGRWNEQKKARFISSRVTTTSNLLKLIQRLEVKPKLLINGSAIGYYGHQEEQELNEQSQFVNGFSHQLCDQWEQEALKFSEHGLRICLLRIGIVLGKNGGPMQQLQAPFSFKLATQLGNGQQWMSWIHLDDVIAMVFYLIDHNDIEGAVNVTAPQPITNAQFVTSLAGVKKTWFKLKIPAPLLKLVVGEMAPEVLLTGQKVLPEKVLKHGYQFKFSDLHSCLKSLS